MMRQEQVSPPLLAALGAMLAAAFAMLALVAQSATVSHLDVLTVKDVHAAVFQPATDLSLAISFLGGTQVVVFVTLAAAALLAARRHWRSALALALSVIGTQVTVALVKALVSRPRPPASDAVTHAAGFSFPSGHSASSMALYAMLAVLAVRTTRGSARTAIGVGAVLAVTAIGASRVYLGVHYPTDVVAGWLTGAIVALGSWCLVAFVSNRRRCSA